MAGSQGAELAQLLLAGFESLVDEVVADLARRGHPGVTAAHEFALQAIDAGARSASELGRRLDVSKQAAGKTIAALEGLGYVERRNDAVDARRKTLTVTPRGRDMMRIGAEAFDRIRDRWAGQVGLARVESVEDALRMLSAARGTPAADAASLT